MVFPEGGRSTDGVILPFLGGTFYVGIKAGVPIVPVAVIGTLQALPMNHYIIKPYPFRVVIGEPIATEGYTPRDMEKLSARVRAALEDLFYSHGEIPDPRTAEDIAEETQAAE
jgi:1-acyl-sn-glycerol-3-phosphate acyltransferase